MHVLGESAHAGAPERLLDGVDRIFRVHVLDALEVREDIGEERKAGVLDFDHYVTARSDEAPMLHVSEMRAGVDVDLIVRFVDDVDEGRVKRLGVSRVREKDDGGRQQ